MGRLVIAIVVLSMTVGCATKGEFKGLADRVATLETTTTDIRDRQMEFGNEVAAVTKKTDEQLASFESRVTAATEQVAAIQEESKRLSSELKEISSKFTKMNSSLTDAQEMLIKNLEHTRDIHQAQYVALSEILEKLRPEEAAPEE